MHPFSLLLLSYLITFYAMLLQVIVSNFDENLSKNGLDGAEYALRTAAEKALDVTRNQATTADLVIGADTVVECDDVLFEKPLDERDALYMIKKLSGRFHMVHTGVALVLPPKGGNTVPDVVKFVVSTRVKFAELTEGEIEAYIKTQEPFGKAGAYGIQGVAAAFVEGVEGCYNNVVGLPTHSLAVHLRELIESGKL